MPPTALLGATALAPVRDNCKVRDLDQAIDLYLDVLQTERGLSEASRRTYQWLLFKFARMYDRDFEPWEITTEHCRLFLSQWRDASNSTKAQHNTTLRRFFAFLADEGIIDENPMENIRRPKRKRPEDLDVVTVSSAEVEKLYAAVNEWDELICLACLTYLGPRRKAAANVRRQDVDFKHGTIRFREKGGKVITKPAPDELLAILRAADGNGVWSRPSDYLIPNRRQPRRKNERSPKVIYAIVKRLAQRAGVDVHPHALRAAFAVRYLEQHPGDLDALQKLMGHSSTDTTRVYLRRQDNLAAMRRVTDLSWALSERGAVALTDDGGAGLPKKDSRKSSPVGRRVTESPRSESARFKPSPAMPPTGFEPVLDAEGLSETLGSKVVELRTHKRKEKA